MPYVLWGSEDGLAKPVMLRDKEGGLMHTGRYWDPETRKHTSGEGPGGRAYSALPFDWDADGDLDLIVGSDSGGLYLRENQGTATEPAFATQVVALRAGGEDAVVPTGYAMPVAADWDGDGRFDLISGAKDGSVWWFRNVGEKGAPELEAPRRLVGSSSKADDAPGEKAQVCVADFDADGDLDLLLGDQRSGTGGRHGYVWLYRRTGVPGGER